jgi:hypothetical protein
MFRKLHAGMKLQKNCLTFGANNDVFRGFFQRNLGHLRLILYFFMGERIYLRKGSSGRGPKISVRQLKPAAKPAAPVSPMQRGQGSPKVVAGQQTAKPKLGGLGLAAMIVAGVSLFCLIISLATRPDAAAEEEVILLRKEKADLARSFGQLQVEHTQLEQGKAKLERHLDSAQKDQRELLALLSKNSAIASSEPPVKRTLPRVPRSSPVVKPPVRTTDHGASCVCATCRTNKNGGSLFPDP